MNAYRRGEKAAKENAGLDSNPYTENTPQWVEWRLGYNDTKAVS